MMTSEQILEEIKSAMILNKDAKARCNEALTHAMSLIVHEAKDLEDHLYKEYERGMEETWEIARELCKTGYDECTELFGDGSVEYVIKNYSPLKVKEMIYSYREEKEKVNKKINVGDEVKQNKDGIVAVILDQDLDTSLEDENYWMVYTENGCVECWCEHEFTKTGEHTDVHNALIK